MTTLNDIVLMRLDILDKRVDMLERMISMNSSVMPPSSSYQNRESHQQGQGGLEAAIERLIASIECKKPPITQDIDRDSTLVGRRRTTLAG